jgi:D-hydroxyproline dehydrogenase
VRGELLIIGGGMVGLACAVRLQAAGWRATVVDPEAPVPAASLGNAGHIALEQVEPLASPATVRSAVRRHFAFGGALDLPIREFGTWGPWALRFVAAATPARFAAGRRALGALMAEAGPAWLRLAQDIGARDLYAESGHLVVWGSAQAAEAGRRAWAGTDIGTTCFGDLESETLERLGARLKTPPAGGIRFQGSGRILDLPALHQRLRAALTGRGGILFKGEAARLLVENGRAVVVLSDGTRLGSDLVLVAAGARSGRLRAGAGHKAPVIAERGYHLHDPDADWPEDLAPLVFEDRSLIVNRFRDGLRCSSFVEFARPETPPDPRKWARLRRHAAELGLPFGPKAREWMGARPTLPDYLPAIGRSRRATNLAYAFGHQHLGLTLSAVTAEQLAAMLDGRDPAVDLRPFDVGRFG